jgi:phosphomannomutase
MAARVRLYTSRWSGQFAVDFTLAALIARCEPLAEQLAASRRTCLLTYDTRFMSQLFARELRRLFNERGVSTLFASSHVSLPITRHALSTGQADCALSVSAGNLPYWHNGLILVSRHADLVLPKRSSAEAATAVFPPPSLDENDPQVRDLRGPYIEMLRAQIDVDAIRRATMTIFVDVMNGASAGCIPAIIGEGQTKAIEINREADPLFGRLVPHPLENGLARLRKLVRESDSHVGVAIAADGTALSVVDNMGNVVAGAKLLLLLARYLQNEYRARGTVITPPEDRAILGPHEQRLGLRVEYAEQPDTTIATAYNDRSLLIGRTPDECFSVGRAASEADAVLAALLVIELIARSGGRLNTLVEELDERTA